MFKAKNKMQDDDTIKAHEVKDEVGRDGRKVYAFPETGHTIAAHSLEEAREIYDRTISQ